MVALIAEMDFSIFHQNVYIGSYFCKVNPTKYFARYIAYVYQAN